MLTILLNWPTKSGRRYIVVGNWRSKFEKNEITSHGRVMEVARHWRSFIKKMHLELQMVTIEWRWPIKLVTGQDKLYCITIY